MDNDQEMKLDYGRKYRIGNFFVFKVCKTLRREDVAELRKQMGLPEYARKHLQRAKLPFIKVEAVSGMWAVEFCCTTGMYRFLDTVLPKAIEAKERGVRLEANNVADFAHMFTIMFMDTTVLGDKEYHEGKAKAMHGFMDRQKASEISREKDDAILDDLRREEEAKATIVDMAKHVAEEGGES